MARPKIEIDGKMVEKFAALGCKVKEIADYFGCSDDTIINRFSEELTKGRSNVRMNLRQWQLQAAQRGNITMMIWLGKQMLGQVDRSIIDITKIDDEQFLEEAKRRLDAPKEPTNIKTIAHKKGS